MRSLQDQVCFAPRHNNSESSNGADLPGSAHPYRPVLSTVAPSGARLADTGPRHGQAAFCCKNKISKQSTKIPAKRQTHASGESLGVRDGRVRLHDWVSGA
jgi:hypothetical protein